MTADISAQITVITEEARAASMRMTPNERNLCDALIDTVDGIYTASEFLRLLIDPESDAYDASHAMLASEVIRILRGTAERACGVHAAVVGNMNGVVVH